MGDEIYLAKLDGALRTIFDDFQPRFVIYVGGVDPYERDQLGGLKISKEGIKNCP